MQDAAGIRDIVEVAEESRRNLVEAIRDHGDEVFRAVADVLGEGSARSAGVVRDSPEGKGVRWRINVFRRTARRKSLSRGLL